MKLQPIKFLGSNVRSRNTALEIRPGVKVEGEVLADERQNIRNVGYGVLADQGRERNAE